MASHVMSGTTVEKKRILFNICRFSMIKFYVLHLKVDSIASRLVPVTSFYDIFCRVITECLLFYFHDYASSYLHKKLTYKLQIIQVISKQTLSFIFEFYNNYFNHEGNHEN